MSASSNESNSGADSTEEARADQADRKIRDTGRVLSLTWGLYAVFALVTVTLHVMVALTVVLEGRGGITPEGIALFAFVFGSDTVNLLMVAGIYEAGRALEQRRNPGLIVLGAVMCIAVPVLQVPQSIFGCAVGLPVWCLVGMLGLVSAGWIMRTLADPDVRESFNIDDDYA